MSVPPSRPSPPHVPARPPERLQGAVLLTGPAGSGKSSQALEWIRLAATDTGHRGRHARSDDRGLLLLPTYAQVTRARRLALTRWGARGVLDAPFATFTGVGERFLPGFEVRALPGPEERDRLMEEALRRAAVAHFDRVRDRPGFRGRLLHLVKELKQTGEDPARSRERLQLSLDELKGSARRRLEGFLRVFEHYEQLLDRAGLVDHEDTLQQVAQALDARASGQLLRLPHLLVVDGFDDFTPVEERILLRLARAVLNEGGAVRVALPFDPARPLLFAQSAPVRARLLALGFEERRLTSCVRAGAPALAALATRLFEPRGSGIADPVPGGAAVETLVAGDGPDEADRVARAVRAWVEAPKEDRGEDRGPTARAWRDVLVVARHLDTTAPAVEAAFERLGIPLRTVNWAPPLADAAALRALSGPLEVLAGAIQAGSFRATALTEWLRWCALSQDDAARARAVDAWEIGQRERGFPASLEAFAAAAPGELAEPIALLLEARAELGSVRSAPAIQQALSRWLERLLPLPLSAGRAADGSPCDPTRDRQRAQAALARGAAQQLLLGLGEAARRTGLGVDAGLADAVRELREALEQTRQPRPDRRLDAVSLVDAEEARFWEAPFVVVLGLEEGLFPLRPREDLLLRDRDRRRLATADPPVHLPLAADREARERRLFYGALTRASQRLLLVRRAFDEQGRPRSASMFLGEVERIVAPTAVGSASGRAAGHIDLALAECFTPQDLRLYAAAALRPRTDARAQTPASARDLARALLLRLSPDVHRRAGADRRREPVPPGSQAGHLKAGLAARLREVTVSDVEAAVQCPMRFYLGSHLGLDASEAPLAGPTVDERVEGRALHQAFERALKDPTCDVTAEVTAIVAAAQLPALQARRIVLEVVRAVHLLRLREAQGRSPFKPAMEALEYEFSGARALPLGTGEGEFLLRGRIDRVDVFDNRAIVVDYKRGTTAAERGYKAERAGTGMQLRLYALAVERLLQLRVVGLEWYAQSERNRRVIYEASSEPEIGPRRESSALTDMPDAEFRAHLLAAEQQAGEAVAGLRRVELLRRPASPDLCADCDVRGICRPDTAWIYAQAGREPPEEAEEDGQ